MGNCMSYTKTETEIKQVKQKAQCIKMLNIEANDEINQQKTIKNFGVGEIEKRKKKKNFNLIANDYEQKIEVFENFKKLQKEMTTKDIQFIMNSLKNNFLFANLNDTEFEVIISNMFYAEVQKDEFIFKQNEKASCYFVIDQGSFGVFIDEKQKKKLKKGDSFGELALLYNAPRSAGLKALEDCKVWGIQRNIFKTVLQDMNNKDKQENKKILNSIKVFEGMTEYQREMLGNNLVVLKYNPNQIIVNKGDQADSFFLIKSGSVGCYDEDKFVRQLDEGDSFGEQALYQNGHRTLTVKAIDQVHCLAVSRETLEKVFGTGIETILQKNTQNWAIENCDLFQQLNKVQIYKWINNSEIIEYQEQTILEKQNEHLQYLYIVLKGKISFGDNDFEKGQIFGKNIIHPVENYKPLKYDLITKESIVSRIKLDVLYKCLGSYNIQDIIEQNKQAQKNQLQIAAKQQSYFDEDLKIENLLYIKDLGEGQFGDVFLVVDQGNLSKNYALKSISRGKIQEHNIQNNIIYEKQVLEKIQYPWITKLYKTFKDDYAAHFLLAAIHGLDMFDMIRQIDLLDNEETRFYIGSMFLCLEYLHSQNIIYRDLKPENTMIDKNGYLHLIDLGTAKILTNDNQRTFTVLGTPHYMAPEIIQGRGYSFMIDFWALGICMYEFQCGYVPFGEEEEDPFEIYRLILKGEYDYPSYFMTEENDLARNFIDILLSKIPEARNNGSYAAIKGHAWFDDFDWNALQDGTLEPPYKPPINDEIDDQEIQQYAKRQIQINQIIKQRYENDRIRQSLQKYQVDWESVFDS